MNNDQTTLGVVETDTGDNRLGLDCGAVFVTIALQWLRESQIYIQTGKQ